jgi:hypothetical protein
LKLDRSELDSNKWDEIQIEGWFKGLLPPSWEIEEDDEVVLFDPAGFGELRISFLINKTKKNKKERAQDIISDWKEELESQYDDDVSVLKRTRKLLVLSVEITASEPEGDLIYWRIIPIIGNKISLDIAYSCPVEDRDREEEMIDAIVDSISLLEPAVQGTVVKLTD